MCVTRPQRVNNLGAAMAGGLANLNTHRVRVKMAVILQTILSYSFLYDNRCTFEMSLKLVLKDPIYNMPALVHIVTWHRSGDKPLSESAVGDSTNTKTCFNIPLLWVALFKPQWVNTLRPEKNVFSWKMKESVWVSIIVAMKFVPKGLTDNKPTLVQVMAWRRIRVQPSPEPILTEF